MTNHREQRLQAAKAFGRFIASSSGRKLLSDHNYDHLTRIVPVMESEPFNSVMEDVMPNGEVLVAIHYPDKPIGKNFSFLMFPKPTRTKPDDWDDENSQTLGADENGDTSSIGMVVHAMLSPYRVKSVESGTQRSVGGLKPLAFA